jgi:predicted nucleotidyltransferase
LKPSLALALHRDEIRRIVALHNGTNPRVFGSALHGDDAEGSDLDLLIDPCEGLGLLGIARMTLEIEALTKVHVDVRTPGDLSEKFRGAVLAEARPI